MQITKIVKTENLYETDVKDHVVYVVLRTLNVIQILVILEIVNFLLLMEEQRIMNVQLQIMMVFCGVSRRKAMMIGLNANLNVLLVTLRWILRKMTRQRSTQKFLDLLVSLMPIMTESYLILFVL